MKKQGFAQMVLIIVTALAIISGGIYLNLNKGKASTTGVTSMKLPGSGDDTDTFFPPVSNDGNVVTGTTTSVAPAVRDSSEVKKKPVDNSNPIKN